MIVGNSVTFGVQWLSKLSGLSAGLSGVQRLSEVIEATAARPASSRATGTRNGEQDT